MFYNWVLNHLFPSNCLFCKSDTKNSSLLCSACIEELPYLKSVCLHCGKSLVGDIGEKNYCGACLNQKFPFENVFIPFQYENPISRLVIDLKFNQKLLYAKILGNLMADFLTKKYQEKEKPQLIIPVPLHKKRLRERGFNQALEIARPIAKKLKIPIDIYSCIRIKNTLAQSILNIEERKQNIKNAFLLKKSLEVNYVAIVDDVMTTGNTVKEFAKILKKSGIMKIDVWCCAKTTIGVLAF